MRLLIFCLLKFPLMLKQLSFFGLIFFSLSCQKANNKVCPYKNQECDSARFTLINRINDTIFYGIGSNMWEDTLLPGQQRRYVYGKVKITYDKNCEEKKTSWSTHQLSSNYGPWAYNIDHCDKKTAFEYDSARNYAVKLFDVSDF